MRHVAVVEEDLLLLLDGPESVYGLAMTAIARNLPIVNMVVQCVTQRGLKYEPVYQGTSEWKLLAPFDHPEETSRCMLSGTGLTHKARQAMHAGPETITDSMRMYQWGVEGGRPGEGAIGVSPEWFYKGPGTAMRAHNEPLVVPSYAEDGGEEPEIAGAYVIDGAGKPRRVGMAVGNEFSDHKFEKRNYLYLASSKLRSCSMGPEIVLNPSFSSVPGEVRVEREGKVLWQKEICTGEECMSHSLANMEHHHFKFEGHRTPGDAHIHFFGADAFRFGAGIPLAEGDVMQVAFQGFGRPLRNPLHIQTAAQELVRVAAI